MNSSSWGVLNLEGTINDTVDRKKQLFILQGLPGVGREKAGRLLDYFGSVEAVISASSSELQSVYGIGKSVADRIKWAVSERMQPFGMGARHPILGSGAECPNRISGLKKPFQPI